MTRELGMISKDVQTTETAAAGTIAEEAPALSTDTINTALPEIMEAMLYSARHVSHKT